MSQNSGFQSILFQHCPCGILVTDQEGSILQLNEAMASMLDGQAEQFLGKTPQTLRPTVYQSLFKGSGVIHLAGPGIERERWLVCNEIDEPSGTTRFYQDVTQQVQLQQQELAGKVALEKQNAELVRQRAENTKCEAEAKAYATDRLVAALGTLDARSLQALTLGDASPETLLALGFQQLAENAAKIGEFNFSPDLLRQLAHARE